MPGQVARDDGGVHYASSQRSQLAWQHAPRRQHAAEAAAAAATEVGALCKNESSGRGGNGGTGRAGSDRRPRPPLRRQFTAKRREKNNSHDDGTPP